MASSLLLGTVFGSLIISTYVNQLGRKTLMLSGILPIVFAWTIFIFAKAAWHLVIGRLFAGFAYAAITSVRETKAKRLKQIETVSRVLRCISGKSSIRIYAENRVSRYYLLLNFGHGTWILRFLSIYNLAGI